MGFMDWSALAQGRDWWRAIVNAEMIPSGSIKCWQLLDVLRNCYLLRKESVLPSCLVTFPAPPPPPHPPKHTSFFFPVSAFIFVAADHCLVFPYECRRNVMETVYGLCKFKISWRLNSIKHSRASNRRRSNDEQTNCSRSVVVLYSRQQHNYSWMSFERCVISKEQSIPHF